MAPAEVVEKGFSWLLFLSGLRRSNCAEHKFLCFSWLLFLSGLRRPFGFRLQVNRFSWLLFLSGLRL